MSMSIYIAHRGHSAEGRWLVNQSRANPIRLSSLNVNNNNNNNYDNVYGAVIMAEPLREFTRFI